MNIFLLVILSALLNAFFCSTLMAYTYRTKTCANDDLSRADQKSRLAIFWISTILLICTAILFFINIIVYRRNPTLFEHTELFKNVSIRNTNIVLAILSIVYYTFILHYLKQSKQYCILDDDTKDINTTLMNSIYASVIINCGFVGYMMGK